MKFYRSWQGVQALSFDLDDTLYENHSVIRQAENKLLIWLAKKIPTSIKLTQNHWKNLQKQAIEENHHLIGNVTEKRRAQLRLAAIECGLNTENAQDLADEALTYFLVERSNFSISMPVFELLRALENKYPIVAITNGNVNCEKLGLSPFFVKIFKAGFDGQAKPSTDMFEQAQRELSISANQILHIGDHLITDVAGAKRAGFKACWLNEAKTSLNISKKASLLPDFEINNIQELRFLL